MEHQNSNDFYSAVPPQDNFSVFADAQAYTPLPDDWWVGTSDIVGSTQAIAQGRYKAVNMVGAAVVSAQMNAHEGADFPFIFGGDGAGFAVPPAWKDRAAAALAAVRTWAQEEFDLTLRVGMVQVAEVYAAGVEINVARFQASQGVDYAMFSGGGLSWAENRMKAGAHSLPDAPAGTRPNLDGLSCRWNHMQSRHGDIVSVVILPNDTTRPADFAQLAHEVLALAGGLERSGHPIKATGPGIRWPPKGITLEAKAQRADGRIGPARRKALFQSFMAWFLVKTGFKLGAFDARHYRRVVMDNADYRKFDDGLKMTLDCDVATQQQLRALLERAAQAGIIRFGLHAQSEAMMTCIVPSIHRDDHVHFIDGAAGGYTAAAQAIKT